MKKNQMNTLMDEAYGVLAESNFDVAIRHAELVMKKAPTDPEPFLLFAEISEQRELFEEALLWVEKGLFFNPQHEGLLLKKAALLIDGFEEVEEAFAILLGLKKQFDNKSVSSLKEEYGQELVLDVFLLLIDCYRLKFDFKKAFTMAEKAKEISPLEERAILALATAHFELGEYKKALFMIEPIEQWHESADFYWLKAQITCADADFKSADEAFLKANRLNKARYHRPIRLDKKQFQILVEQALLALPKEIREHLQKNIIDLKEIVPISLIKKSNGTLSPEAPIALDTLPDDDKKNISVILLFQKNIENLAAKKEEVRDLIASALIHEADKPIIN